MNYRKIENFDNYIIFNNGKIYSLKSKRFLKPNYNIDNYLIVSLFDNNKNRKYFRVHRLVFEAFNGIIPEGLEVDHINGIRDDNRLINLRLLTPKENCQSRHHLEEYKQIERERYIKRKDRRKEYHQKYYEQHKEEINKRSLERYYNKN